MDKFEIKYVVDSNEASAFLERASRWMRPDPHADGLHGYTVRTLYFDTADKQSYRDVVEGQALKRKFRMRRYGLAPGPVFFEVKSRYNRMVVKERGLYEPKLIEEFLRDPFDSLPKAIRRHGPSLARRRHTPAVAVCYDRIALEDFLGAGTRVTLDRNIRCGGADLFDRPAGVDELRVLPPGMLVLELKFQAKLPGWLANAVLDLELTPREYSKYVHSLRRVHPQAQLITEVEAHG